ncbi:MAG: hypothetical protein K0U72_18230 [Gammaproteobacteria bacterium]|nr:hypothetical protein [Gammaproteobacteria bacterium]
MSVFSNAFDSRGYICLADVMSVESLNDIKSYLESSSTTRAGDRRLLDHSWCRDLAGTIRDHLECRKLIAGNYVATLCTYFDKSADSNWGVASHRDLSVPVKRKFCRQSWKNWTVKQGIPHVQPPTQFLLGMFAIRLNIDHSTAENGALIVSPCSHQTETADPPSVVVEGLPRSALMMSPMLVHASRKSTNGTDRRVLHFLFGPSQQSSPVEWFYAA